MSNLDYNLPEPTKAQLEYARYLSRFQAPRERRTLFARTESISQPPSVKRPRTILERRRPCLPGRYRSPVCRCSLRGAKPRLKRCSPQPMRWGRHSRVAAFQSREHSVSGVGIRQYAQRSMLAYTVCSSDPRGAKGIGGDAAGCSDDLVHGQVSLMSVRVVDSTALRISSCTRPM